MVSKLVVPVSYSIELNTFYIATRLRSSSDR